MSLVQVDETGKKHELSVSCGRLLTSKPSLPSITFLAFFISNCFNYWNVILSFKKLVLCSTKNEMFAVKM